MFSMGYTIVGLTRFQAGFAAVGAPGNGAIFYEIAVKMKRTGVAAHYFQ
jgi:hypothetical protein